MEQVIPLSMLALAIAFLALIMRIHSYLSDVEFDTDVNRTVHETSIPVRVAAALITFGVLMQGAEAAQTSTAAVFSGLFVLIVLAYVNAYLWQFRATLSGDELTVMLPNFQTRTYDLSRLIEVEDTPTGTWGLRFQGGEVCWVLKYLSGRSILRRALAEAQPYY